LKLLIPSSRGRIILSEACALFSLAVLIFAIAGQSITLAMEMPHPDATPSGVFDSLAITKTAQPNVPCAAGVALVRWLPKTNVRISFVRGEFTDSEKSALRKAIDLWQRAVSRMGLEITFAVGVEVEPSVIPSLGEIVVRRDYQMEDGKYGRIVASARADNYLDRASILVNGAIHERKILRKLMMHELGHALGLRDCSDCGTGKSVMNHFSLKSILGLGVQDRNVASKPTLSDIAQVEKGYRQAAVPQSQTTSTETQIVVAEENLIAAAPPAVLTQANILIPYLTGPSNGARIGEVAGARILAGNQIADFNVLLSKFLSVEGSTMEELKNYSFKRDVRIQTIDDKGRVAGEYRRVSDMLLDDEGRRVERNVSFLKPTLRGLEVTDEYVEDFSGAQLKGFELNQRDAYRFEPFGFEPLNGKSARVYRLTPLNLETAKATGARVLYGFIWIDEQTGAIMKVAGRALPELKQRYPLFETHRELIDGKHFFPVRTLADDYLVFPSRRVHVRMLITYSNYKRFAARVNIIELDEPQP
jgi:hypothetical protein